MCLPLPQIPLLCNLALMHLLRRPARDPNSPLLPLLDLAILFSLCYLFISDNNWPKDLCLNHLKSNWEEWSLHMTLIANRHGLADWLDGSFLQPDVTTNPKGHHIWKVNDCSLKVFILQHVSRTNYKIVANLPDASSVFNSLHKHHEALRTHTQVLLIAKAFNTCFCPGTAMS